MSPELWPRGSARTAGSGEPLWSTHWVGGTHIPLVPGAEGTAQQVQARVSGQRERRDGTAHTAAGKAAGARGAEEGVGVIPLLPGQDGGSRAPAGTDTTFVPSLPPAPRTHRITITNFCLGKHLVSEGDLLKDQRGSPAYISPDVLSGMCGVPGSGPQGLRSAGLHRGSRLQQSVSGGGPGPGAGTSVGVRTSTVCLRTKFGVLWGRKMVTLTLVQG